MNNERARPIDVPFSRGVRQDIESRTAPLGALTAADNLEFDHQNRLVRRDSFADLNLARIGKTNVIDFPVRRVVQAPTGERLLFTDHNTFEHYPSTGGTTEAGIDSQLLALRATLRDTAGIAADECGLIQFCDTCAVNGYIVYAYAKRNDDPLGNTFNIFVDVLSVKDGARVVTQKLISGSFQYAPAAGQVRCVVSGGSNIAFVVWCAGSSATTIAQARITLATGAVVVDPATALVTDADTPAHFDVDRMATGWILVYARNDGAHKARVVTYNSTPAQVASFSWLAAAGTVAWQPSALAVCGNAIGTPNRVHVAGYNPATFLVEGLALLPALTTPAYSGTDPGLSHTKPVRQMTLGRYSNVASQLLFSNYSSVPLSTSLTVTTNPRGHLHVWAIGDDASVLQATPLANYSLASKIYHDTRAVSTMLVMARFDDPSGFQSHYLLLDLGAGQFGFVTPTLHVASGRVPLEADNAYTGIGGICDLSFQSPGLFQIFLKVNAGASQISGNQVIAYTFASCRSDRFLSTPCQGEATIGGGTPLVYDSQRLVELSFYSYPVVNAGNAFPYAALGSMAQGIYQYRYVYEWTDARGNRQQSPASVAATVDLSGAPYAAGTNRVEFFLPAYGATRKQSFPIFAASPDASAPIRVVPYRTLVGSAGPFYRLPVAGVNKAGSTDASLVVDAYADATISGNEILYERNGGRGELATTAPPPSLLMTTHAQRLWGLDGEDPERIWCTKVLSPLTAPGYSPALQVLIPGAGRINGIAGQDGKLYALATNGVYLASYGDGPDNAGNGAFPSPQLITTEATCEDPRGVLVASNGIYFTGRDKWGVGIYLIRRGDGNPVAIGRRLRTELALYPVCRGAIDRADKSRVEFLFTQNDRSEQPANASIIAYYHYDIVDEEGIGQWTVARPSVGDNAEFECLGIWTETVDDTQNTVGLPALVSVLADTQTNGHVGAQRPGSLRDFGGDIPRILIETADIRAFGMVGFGGIRGVTMYGTSIATDPLRMEASFDSGASWTEAISFGSIGATGEPILLRWETPTQKLPDGGMIRLRIADEAQGEFLPGSTWFHGISVEAEPLGGNARLPSTNRG